MDYVPPARPNGGSSARRPAARSARKRRRVQSRSRPVPPDLWAAWLPIATKLLLTAAIVVAATVATERAGPYVGAVVVTLPVTTWPAYLFLALDHDGAYIAASALAGLAMVAVNVAYMLIYVVLAQRRGLAASFCGALAVWILLGVVVRRIEWSVAGVVLLDAVAFAAAVWWVAPYRRATMPPVRPRWYDIPVRVLVVCAVMGTILALGQWAGPEVTGFAAVFPASSASALIVLHPRIGGKATGAMVANGILCHVGIGGAVLGLHLAVGPCGLAGALAVALVIPVTWNFTLWAARARLAAA
jgi:hypothetical protein